MPRRDLRGWVTTKHLRSFGEVRKDRRPHRSPWPPPTPRSISSNEGSAGVVRGEADLEGEKEPDSSPPEANLVERPRRRTGVVCQPGTPRRRARAGHRLGLRDLRAENRRALHLQGGASSPWPSRVEPSGSACTPRRTQRRRRSVVDLRRLRHRRIESRGVRPLPHRSRSSRARSPSAKSPRSCREHAVLARGARIAKSRSLHRSKLARVVVERSASAARHPLFGPPPSASTARTRQRLERAVEPASRPPRPAPSSQREAIDQQRPRHRRNRERHGPARTSSRMRRGPLHQPPAASSARFPARLRCQHIEAVHARAQMSSLGCANAATAAPPRPAPHRPYARPYRRSAQRARAPIVATERRRAAPGDPRGSGGPGRPAARELAASRKATAAPRRDPHDRSTRRSAALGGVQASQDQLGLRREAPPRRARPTGPGGRPEVETGRPPRRPPRPAGQAPPPPASRARNRARRAIIVLSRPGLAGQHFRPAGSESCSSRCDDEACPRMSSALSTACHRIRATRPGSHGPRLPKLSLRFRTDGLSPRPVEAGNEPVAGTTRWTSNCSPVSPRRSALRRRDRARG